MLVTGASGFIGSHLVENLLKKNFKVKALVRYNSSSNINWLEHINQNNSVKFISNKKKSLNLLYPPVLINISGFG